MRPKYCQVYGVQFSVVVGGRTASIPAFDLRVFHDNPVDSHDNIVLGGVPSQSSVRPGSEFVFTPFIINPGNHRIVFESSPSNLVQYGLALDHKTGAISGRLTRTIEGLSISASIDEIDPDQAIVPHGLIGPICDRIRDSPGDDNPSHWIYDDQQNVYGNPAFTDSNGVKRYYRCVETNT